MIPEIEESLRQYHQTQQAIAFVVFGVIAIGVWLGRKRLFRSLLIGFVALLLAAIIIPGAVPARPTAYRNACIFNLKKIQESKLQWVSDHPQSNREPTDADLFGTNAYMKWKPVCPGGGVYDLRLISEKPKCSLEKKGHSLKD